MNEIKKSQNKESSTREDQKYIYFEKNKRGKKERKKEKETERKRQVKEREKMGVIKTEECEGSVARGVLSLMLIRFLLGLPVFKY